VATFLLLSLGQGALRDVQNSFHVTRKGHRFFFFFFFLRESGGTSQVISSLHACSRPFSALSRLV